MRDDTRRPPPPRRPRDDRRRDARRTNEDDPASLRANLRFDTQGRADVDLDDDWHPDLTGLPVVDSGIPGTKAVLVPDRWQAPSRKAMRQIWEREIREAQFWPRMFMRVGVGFAIIGMFFVGSIVTGLMFKPKVGCQEFVEEIVTGKWRDYVPEDPVLRAAIKAYEEDTGKRLRPRD